MKKITCNLNDLESLKTQLEAYKKDLDMKMQEAIKEMASKTTEQLQTNYGDIRVAGDNTPPVVTPTISGNSATISAKGDNIAFIEFGTGITMPEHTLQNEIEGIVGHGQYGKKQGSNLDGWWFSSYGNVDWRCAHPAYDKNGRMKAHSYHTYGNIANMQVYNASKWLRQNYIDIIKDKLK